MSKVTNTQMNCNWPVWHFSPFDLLSAVTYIFLCDIEGMVSVGIVLIFLTKVLWLLFPLHWSQKGVKSTGYTSVIDKFPEFIDLGWLNPCWRNKDFAFGRIDWWSKFEQHSNLGGWVVYKWGAFQVGKWKKNVHPKNQFISHLCSNRSVCGWVRLNLNIVQIVKSAQVNECFLTNNMNNGKFSCRQWIVFSMLFLGKSTTHFPYR